MSEDFIGKNIGPYEILSVIGRGPNSVVYRAYQAGANRTVAVKMLAPELGEEPDFEARFERDVRRLAELDHPHILPLFDAGVIGGYPFIIMEYMTGGTLSNLIARYGKLGLTEAVPLMQQIAAALDYAHSKGIIHRYLKPSNILLDEQGEAYVTDFGIGQVREAVASAHQSGVLSGASYVSPEVISGVKRITNAADVYSLGVIAFEMLTGMLPFKGRNAAETARMHLTEDSPSATAFNPELPNEVDAVLAKALAKQPKDRYATAGLLASGLASAARISGSAVRHRPTTETGTAQMIRPPMPAAPPKAPAPPTPLPGAIKAINAEPVTPPPGMIKDSDVHTPPPGFVTPPLGAFDADAMFESIPSTPPPSSGSLSLSTGLTPPPGSLSTGLTPPPGSSPSISWANLPPKERKKMQKERERQRKELRRKLGAQGPRWYTAAMAILLVLVVWFSIGAVAGTQIRRQQQMNAIALLISEATATANAAPTDAIPATDEPTQPIVVPATTDEATATETLAPTDTPTDAPTNTPTPTATITVTAAPTALGGTQGKIAFVSSRDGDAELFVHDIATGQNTQLTDNTAREGWPVWSPDGSLIAFWSDETAVGQHIYIINPDSTNMTRLTSGNRTDNYPVFSPDGESIAFHATDDIRSFIYRVTLDGDEEQITQIPTAENRVVDWSPDGSILTYFGFTSAGLLEMLQLDTDSGVRTPITATNGAVEFLNFSPDRSQVVFTRFFSTGRQIFIADTDCPIITDCNPRRITNDRFNWQRPRFSPDGTLLIVTGNVDGNNDLFILTLEGTILSQITTDPAEDYEGVWQP